MKKRKLGLLVKLLLGILTGTLLGSLGHLLNIQDSMAFEGFVSLYVTFTSLFSTFLSFIIPLLIVSFVAAGLADLGKKANKLFGVTLLLAYASTVIAGFASFLAGKALLPSLIREITGVEAASKTFEALFTIEAEPVFGVMTALILAFLLGLGMANSKGTTLLKVIKDLQEIISKTLNKVIIPLIPVYVAGLFCKIAAEGKLIQTIQMFVKLFIMILVFQWLYIGLQFLISSLVCKENKFKNLKNAAPAYFTALGTQSSASTIPVNLESAKKNGVAGDIADFVIPLCATIHLAGDTICLVLGAMGIMIANGMNPTLGMFTPFILMLGITMVAAPGVPGGGVMAALGLITSMLGFTEPMSQLIISLHFSQDSFGTACNITGDQAIAFIVDKVDRRSNSQIPENRAQIR
ncbi:dicarboxylate/amino acid:cation symporter [Qiania dongpingensis]|uniref:Dicarboxylate/amino acid:cation symporter n=1 Tax=Qiania dongpingensis TaxID=2763669 RepID=A0A7G9G0W9_9FIRM|nr:dicarboxylate/amino acid:cation symporter [Qiania dongpingensis]QNM04451.1 dicarboxylate/amino acid:cation symporter [Qiania dongpingensis]